MQCVIPVDMILWKEAQCLTQLMPGTDMVPLHMLALAKALLWVLSQFISKAEKAIWHFVANDKGSVLPLSEHVDEGERLICFNCKREPYPFLQMAIQQPFFASTAQGQRQKRASCSPLQNNSETFRGRLHEVRDDGVEERGN